MDRVREQTARHPGRVVYPSFDPDRPQEPWVPIQENREFWKRTQPRKATFTTVQKGWPTEPVKADPPSGMNFNIDGVPIPYTHPDHGYLMRLQNELPDVPRRGYW